MGRADGKEQVFFWQHGAYFLPNEVTHQGDILVFNNGVPDVESKADYGQIYIGMLLHSAYSDALEITARRTAK